MAKTKHQKEQMIKELSESIEKQKAMVLVDFGGVKSDILFALRNKLREAGCLLKVVKKTLFQKSLEKRWEKGLMAKLGEIKNQLAIAFSFDDETTAGRICRQFSKENVNLKILGGVVGNEFLEKEKMIELADLPSREELLSRLAYVLISPLTRFAFVLKSRSEKSEKS